MVKYSIVYIKLICCHVTSKSLVLGGLGVILSKSKIVRSNLSQKSLEKRAILYTSARLTEANIKLPNDTQGG